MWFGFGFGLCFGLGFARCAYSVRLLGVLVEDQARVRAAEAEGVGHDPVDLALVALGQDVHALGLVHLVGVRVRVRVGVRVRVRVQG